MNRKVVFIYMYIVRLSKHKKYMRKKINTQTKEKNIFLTTEKNLQRMEKYL